MVWSAGRFDSYPAHQIQAVLLTRATRTPRNRCSVLPAIASAQTNNARHVIAHRHVAVPTQGLECGGRYLLFANAEL
jgi:hypothetical protein